MLQRRYAHRRIKNPTRSRRTRALTCESLEERALLSINTSVGVSFTAGTFDTAGGFFPPDTMGAVSDSHIVELINGRYAVYSKDTGAEIESSSQNQFWTDAGVNFTNFTFDPRVLYDSASGRWFATAVDNPGLDNQVLLAVSETSDPTGDWNAFGIDSDSNDQRWADFPTLGLDANGVFISADMVPIVGRGAAGRATSILSVPKSDLLLSTPVFARAAYSENVTADAGRLAQPAVDLGPADGPAPILAAQLDPNSDQIIRSSIFNAGGNAIFAPGTTITTPFLNPAPPTAEQPGAVQNLDTRDQRFSGNVVEIGDSLWAVQTVDDGGQAALRWYEINEDTNAIIQTGLISDPSLDLFYPSIAVNDSGVVVIGFSGSSETQFPSAYSVVGETKAGVTSFGQPILLQAGEDTYVRTDSSSRNRWGDYSATVVDPSDPNVFWTFQQYALQGGDEWGINVSQIITSLVPDQFEANETIATATVLGSVPELTLRDLTIHNDTDVDIFQVTANQTGALIVNTLFEDAQGDLDLRVRDASGTVLASSISSTDDEQIVVPVVSQQRYFVEVAGFQGATNRYELEVENFAAPAPSSIFLDPASDTGMMNNDHVTFDTTPRLLIQADLPNFVGGALPILSAAQAIAGNTPGAAVFVSLTNISTGATTTGFASQVGSSSLFEITPGALTDGSYSVSAAVQIFDGQSPSETGRVLLGQPLLLTVDATLDVDPSLQSFLLIRSSDSGMLNDDRVTNKMQPAFSGRGPANHKVRVFADLINPDPNVSNTIQLVAQGTVGSDLSDGFPGDGAGLWELTSEPLIDGTYDMRVEFEDAAGNVHRLPPGLLFIHVDTEAPNTPLLDLVAATDTGRSDVDNVTFADPLELTVTAHDPDINTPDPPRTPDPRDIKIRIFDRPGDGSGEVLIVDSFTETGGFISDGFYDSSTLASLAVANLSEGVHDLKLEIEDRAGNISHDFLLDVEIDRTKPPVSFGFDNVDDDGLLPTSDTGAAHDPPTFADQITKDDTPTLWGRAEANAIVEVYADVNADGAIDAGDVLLGTTVAVPDSGNSAFPGGRWELTSSVSLNDSNFFSTTDGVRQLLVVAEDVAGNTNPPDDDPVDNDGNPSAADLQQRLALFLDTQGPRVDSVVVTDNEDFELFTLKPSNGVTPPISSLDVTLIDEPERVGGLVLGSQPDVVFVIDISGSTSSNFGGTPVGDLNSDGSADTILDAEIAAFAALNQTLIDLGFGGSAEVAIVAFDDQASILDMDPVAPGIQTSAAPNANADGDADLDVVQVLQSLQVGGLTNYEDALQETLDVINTLGTTFANGNVVFLSDGFPTAGGSFDDEANLLRTLAGNVRAFGVGPGAAVGDLQTIDSDAEIFANTDELLDVFGGGVGGSSGAIFNFVYPAVNEVAATSIGNYQLVGDATGNVLIGSVELVDFTTAGNLGRTTVRLIFTDAEGNPAYLPDDRFTLTISDNLTDDAGNRLDGESQAASPFDQGVLGDEIFPSGDGAAGGNFVARFTVDSRPELGVWGAEGVWLDTNGNHLADPHNTDVVNRDIVHQFGLATDDVFAGKFVAPGMQKPDDFDRLGAYGSVNGQFRFLIDFTNDGVPDAFPALGPGLQRLNINGVPIAGEFDGNADNGDEVGVYNGQVWYFDTNRNFHIDSGDATFHNGIGMGYPVVGDFDGNGHDDLAGWFNDVFQVFSASNTLNFNQGATQFRFGFPGVGERPVAADFDRDGVDDIGLWVPRRAGSESGAEGEWYLLVSGNSTGVADPQSVLDRIEPGEFGPEIAFTPVPFGPDIHATFGDEFALPVVGNFDPPLPVVPPAATIAGRFTFYNNSMLDGHNAAANSSDDGAIAAGKQALLPGQTSSAVNFTSFSAGTTGLLVDVKNLADPENISQSDFQFRVGDGSLWTTAPVPLEVTVRKGAGVGGSDRITITWADGAISATWLEVKMLANARTGLAAPDVHYWGNAPGDVSGDGQVTNADLLAVRRNNHRDVPRGHAADFDMSGRIDAADLRTVTQMLGSGLNQLASLTAPGSAGSTAPAVAPQQAVDAALADIAGSEEDGERDDDELLALLAGGV